MIKCTIQANIKCPTHTSPDLISQPVLEFKSLLLVQIAQQYIDVSKVRCQSNFRYVFVI